MKISRLLTLGCALLIGIPAARAAEQDVTAPVWSFDANKIAYCVATFAKTDDTPPQFVILSSEIWAANKDGSGARRLTTGSTDNAMRWSPDGKHIAFVRKDDIWMVGADGTGLKQITKTPAINESMPEFSNDGKTLFYVRTEFLNYAEFLVGTEKVLKNKPGVVIAYSLVSGQEKERFKGPDSILQIVPNRADPGEVFLFYNANNAATNKTYAVAAAKLDGSGRRIIKEDPNSEIQALHAHFGGVAIETSGVDKDLKKTHQLLVQSKATTKTIDCTDLPRMSFNSLSLDGNSVIGAGVVMKEFEGDFLIERSIKIYEPATQKETNLERKALLGQAVAPVPVVAPAPPVPATKPVPPTQTAAVVPAAAKAHFDEGSKNLKLGFLGVAVDEFTQAIALHPNYLDAHRQLAKSYAQRFEWAEAIENMDAVLRLTPNDSEAFYERADYNAIAQNYDAAESDYNNAIRLAPKNPELYRARAAFLRKIGGDKEKAQAQADEQKAKELEAK